MKTLRLSNFNRVVIVRVAKFKLPYSINVAAFVKENRFDSFRRMMLPLPKRVIKFTNILVCLSNINLLD